MNIDPRHLLQLAVILDEGSFIRAAEVLNMTQPALSRNIKTMEDRIGAVLLDRRNKKIKATELGRHLAQQGHLIRTASLQAAQDAMGVALGKGGTLRIGVPPLISQFFFGRKLPAFLVENPGVTCKVTIDMVPPLMSLLEHGQLDVVIGPIVLTDETKGLQATKLWSDTVNIFCGPQHPLSRRKRVSVEDLRQSRWIFQPENSFLNAQMSSYLTSAGLSEVSAAIEVNTPISVIALLGNSELLTMLPSQPVADLVHRGELFRLTFQDNVPERHVGLIRRKLDGHAPLIDNFSRFLVGALDDN